MTGISSDLAGRIFGNQFRLQGLLGRGGMGDVYVAEQLELGRRVVIKLLTAQQWSEHEPEERFRREARVLAQLNHPNIVQLYTVGRTDEGVAYLAMEYVDGRTLSSLLAEEGAMTEAEVLPILDQLCSALAEAHERGIVHRDLKPDNVMLVRRRHQPPLVKVLDFGIAKLMHPAEPRLTKKGSILGTPQYMAPEQLREHAVDGRTDIYAVGLIAYELLTGTVPFEAENTMKLMIKVLSDEAVPPTHRAHGVEISAPLEAVILRCLAKEPEQRFQSVLALREALHSIPRPLQPIASTPLPASPAPPRAALTVDASDLESPRASYGPSRASRTLAAIAAVLALGLSVVGVVFWLGPWESDAAPKVASGPLQVREWVQGIPFPEGTEYDQFEATFIDARIAADRERVIAFYREHLREKWGGVQDVGSGLAPQNPDAPIKTLTVTEAREGARLHITRNTP